MIHKIFRRSIKARFIIMMVGILLSVVFILTLVTAFTSARLLEEESERQLSQSLSQSIEMLSGFINTREINLDIWSSNPLINAIFEDPALAMVFVPSLREYFSKIREKEPWISNIFLIQEDEPVYDDSDAFEFSDGSDGTPGGMKNLLSLPDHGISVINLNQFNQKLNKNVILIKRNIVKNGSAAKKNFIVLILDMEIINNRLFGNIRIGRRGFVVMAAKNMSGQIAVSASVGEGIEKESFSKAAAQWKKFADIPDRSPFILIRKQILPSYALAVLGVASLNDIREPVIYLIYLSVIFSIIASGIGIWSAVFFSGKLINPIFKLIHTIGLISKGDLTQRVDVGRQDEIGILAIVFNKMTAKLQENHAALKKAEEKYRSIFENAVEGIFQSTADGYFLSVNPALAEILGYDSPDEVIGDASDIALHCYVNPDSRKIFYETLSKKGKIVNFEVQQRRKDGSIIWLSISARSIRNVRGRVMYYEGSFVDITPRKSAEDTLKKYQEHLEEMVEKRTAELRQTKDYLENVLKNSADGIGLADMHGKMISWNKAAEELYGYTSEEIRGTYFSERYTDKNGLEKMLSELRENGSVKHYEILMRKKDGTDSPFEVSIALLKDENKKNIGSICVARDLSELKKVLTETRIAREAAEQANRKITESIVYAKMIQRSLLANLDEVKSYLPDSFFVWEPRDIVGGDIFYTDAFKDGFIVAVIDCTGHGVPGAFMTMIVISALKRIVRDDGCYDPAEILKRLNHIVKTTLQQDKEYAVSDDGLDIGICFVRTETSEVFKTSEVLLTFAGAKIPLYFICNKKTSEVSETSEVFQSDGVNIIKGDRKSLGYRRSDLDFDFTNHTVDIEKGMRFYMATDGFADQLGKNGRRFSTDRLKNLLKEINREPFEKQRNMLVQVFEDYRGENERQDDMTVVGFGF